MKEKIKQLNWFNFINRLKEILLDMVDGSSETKVTTEDIEDATDIGKSLMKATTVASARTAIGAGTSSLSLGTTATTAKAGNYTPSSTEVLTAIKAMTEAQKNELKESLGITV